MLETSDFLKDDCLKINCTVGVVVSAIDCSRLHLIQVPESDIGAQFGMSLENGEGSDIIFDVAGKKFHAHKLVLAARSPVFRAEFLNATEEDGYEIVVTDMESKVFQVTSSNVYGLITLCTLVNLSEVCQHSNGFYGGCKSSQIRNSIGSSVSTFELSRQSETSVSYEGGKCN